MYRKIDTKKGTRRQAIFAGAGPTIFADEVLNF